MCLWCRGVFRWAHVNSDGACSGRLCCVFGWVYVKVFNGAVDIVRVFWICDVPVSYAETVDYRDGSAGSCAQVCSAGFWVSK